MKKLIVFFTVLTIILSLGSVAIAENYDYSSFMREWYYSKDKNTVLHIDNCNGKNISMRIDSPDFNFTVYEGAMTENKASCVFDAVDNYGVKLSGAVEMSFYIDNIWVSIYTYDDRELFNGMFVSDEPHFNPYAGAYSYNVKINLNNELQNISPAPMIVNGNTYVPLRSIFYAMNCNVYWDEFTQADGMKVQMITGARNNRIVKLYRTNYGVGYSPWRQCIWDKDYVDTADYKSIEDCPVMVTQPLLINDSSYVPLRVIAESFGAEVSWDGETNTVLITNDTTTDTKKSEDDIAKIEDFLYDHAYEIAKNSYENVSGDNFPYYTFKNKYYKFTAIRDGETIYFKVFDNGDISEYIPE